MSPTEPGSGGGTGCAGAGSAGAGGGWLRIQVSGLFALDGDSPDPDPQEVADAIVHAALDADAPFRQFVGTDSQLISGAKASMSFEDFEATMRNTIDWHE